MIKAGVGLVSGEDSYNVGVDACHKAIEGLGAEEPKLIIVLSSVEYDQEKMLSGVRSVSGDTLMVGSSTAGEITTDGPAKKHSVAVMAIASDRISFSAAVGKNLKEDSRKAGADVAEAVKEQASGDMKLFMMFADGLSGNGSDVVRGILSILGEHFPVVGGSAGDDAQYKRTYQYLQDSVTSDSVIGVGLSGDFKFSIGVKHGWVPVGVPMKITKSDGAVIKEIDGQPAIKIFEDYFGEERAGELKNKTLAELALAYPLGLKETGSDELLLRAPFFVDKEGSITCGGEVPEGSEIRLMIGSSEGAIAAARNAALNAMDQLEGTPKVVIIFNCHVRDKLFGNRDKAKEEIDAIQLIIGKDVPLIGFYTYAEQAPLAGETQNIKSCKSAVHNETIVILILGE